MADITLGEILHRKSGGDINEDNPLAMKQVGSIVSIYSEEELTIEEDDSLDVTVDEILPYEKVRIGVSFADETFQSAETASAEFRLLTYREGTTSGSLYASNEYDENVIIEDETAFVAEFKKWGTGAIRFFIYNNDTEDIYIRNIEITGVS